MLLASCAEHANIWMVVGYFVIAIKIIIPLAIMLKGLYNLSLTVKSSTKEGMQRAIINCFARFTVAVLLFFIPALVSVLFSSLVELKQGDYNICVQCVTSVSNCQLYCVEKSPEYDEKKCKTYKEASGVATDCLDTCKANCALVDPLNMDVCELECEDSCKTTLTKGE